MRKSIIFIFAVFVLTNCKKDNNSNSTCNNLITVKNWTTIPFKTNYTIQVPDTFVGVGMAGFEGPTFSKSSSDNKIVLWYMYSNDLFCADFGDTLQAKIPSSLTISDNLGNTSTLNMVEKFCQNSQTIGILYYSNSNISNGILFWKDKGFFKMALQIQFYMSDLKIAIQIIETIKTSS